MGLCENCQIGKMGKTSFKSKNYHSKKVLEVFHTYLCRPIGIESYSGDKCYLILTHVKIQSWKIIFVKKHFSFDI